MRILITALSIILFILAGIIAFKAAMLPDAYMGYSMPEETHPRPPEEAGSAYTRDTGNPHNTRLMAADVKSGMSESGSSGAIRRESGTRQDHASASPPKGPSSASSSRVLAVLGGEGTFRSGQIVLSESVMNTIDRLVREINSYPGARVVIEGHTDNVPIRAAQGSRYYDNMELSFLRAKAVADLLVKNGIARERISVTGYGDARPIDTNDTPEGRARNRRVEVRLVTGTGEY
jgi:flagellar motor protein MotB